MECHFEVINLRSGTNDPEDTRVPGILAAEEVDLEDHHNFKGVSEAHPDLAIWVLKEVATRVAINAPLTYGDFQ